MYVIHVTAALSVPISLLVPLLDYLLGLRRLAPFHWAAPRRNWGLCSLLPIERIKEPGVVVGAVMTNQLGVQVYIERARTGCRQSDEKRLCVDNNHYPLRSGLRPLGNSNNSWLCTNDFWLQYSESW